MVHYNIVCHGGCDIQRVWLLAGQAMSQTQWLRWNVIWAASALALWRERNKRLLSNKRRVIH